MADFPYTVVPARLKGFFGHMQSGGTPDKVTRIYLEKVGFRSKNDRAIIPILKFLGFLDSSGVPTDLWQAYRDRESARGILADAIRRAYADLFATYPDAHRKDNEALRNYFSAHTRVAERGLAAIVGTFKALVEFADFEAPPAELPEVEAPSRVTPLSRAAGGRAMTTVPAININVQLQLPATDDASVYDKLFAALKKHLLEE